jgi:hypothetical protein
VSAWSCPSQLITCLHSFPDAPTKRDGNVVHRSSSRLPGLTPRPASVIPGHPLRTSLVADVEWSSPPVPVATTDAMPR